MQEWTEEEVKLAVEQGKTFCLYVYTPMCGTCQVASKILTVSLDLVPQLEVRQNEYKLFSRIGKTYEIESVPCLLLFKNGSLQNKIYAFQSVPYIYGLFKNL